MKIALIGAGPRNIALLDRLRIHNPEAEITVFDPDGWGGRVWRPTQSPLLLMNTPAGLITVFSDPTVTLVGARTDGPTLAEWCRTTARDYLTTQTHLDVQQRGVLTVAATRTREHDYAPRALFGCYLQWAAAHIQARTTQPIQLVHAAVTAVHPTTNGYLLTTADGRTFGTETAPFAKCVLTLGHLPQQPTADMRATQQHADSFGGTYIAPALPDTVNTTSRRVIIRGLGLSFFDIVTTLTAGRGGTYTRGRNGLLQYHASGREPEIIAGSRSGLPYRAKGRDEKMPGQVYQPHFLTPERLADWQQSGKLPTVTELGKYLRLEFNCVYCMRQVPANEQAAFSSAFAENPQAALAQWPTVQLPDWEAITQAPDFKSENRYTGSLLARLDADVRAAMGGNCTDPLASALEALRDMRVPLRQLLMGNDALYLGFRDQLAGRLNMLTVGPPLQRIDELQALIRAGVVRLLPPGMAVDDLPDGFCATATSDPTYFARAATLIDARLPAINADQTASPLAQQLLRDGLAVKHLRTDRTDKGVLSGALAVDADTSQLKRSDGTTQDGLYLWGVPTEGQFWLTTASPHPFMNDINLRTADKIAQLL